MNYLSNIFKNKEMFLIKFFFFIICTIYFYQINKFVNNNIHATTTWWLYNYSQGFIKRGFVGEILFFLTKTFNICLLYTSPSPRDRTRSRMPSSA